MGNEVILDNSTRTAFFDLNFTNIRIPATQFTKIIDYIMKSNKTCVKIDSEAKEPLY